MGQATPSRTQLAGIAGWAPRGSNLRNRLAELAGRQLIAYPAPGLVALTADGRAAAPAPDVSLTLLDSVRGILTGPQRTLFEVLLTGRARSREDLAVAVGWEPGGSNLRNRLAEMSRLELVAYPARGLVELQEWVRP